MVIDKPVVAMLYVLQGCIPLELKGGPKSFLLEDTQYLCYLPAGQHPIKPGPRGSDMIQINFGPHLLEELSLRHPHIRDVWQLAVSGADGGLMPDAPPMTANARTMLEIMCGNNLHPEELPAFMRARINDLLLEYARAPREEDFQYNTRYNFSPSDMEAIQQAATIIAEDFRLPIQRLPLSKRFAFTLKS